MSKFNKIHYKNETNATLKLFQINSACFVTNFITNYALIQSCILLPGDRRDNSLVIISEKYANLGKYISGVKNSKGRNG